MKRLILLTQFLTRIPIPMNVSATDEDFNKAIVYFPVVGAIIGVLLYGLATLSNMFLDAFSTAVLIVIFEALITGGLHLDGLADSFDGLYSYRNKERILEIMKDSRIGANGVLALIGIFLLKIVFIAAALPLYGPVSVFLMPVFTRAMIVYASLRSKYARPSGMGNYFIGRVSGYQWAFVMIFSVSLSLICLPIAAPVFIVLMVFGEWYCWHCKKIIDGMTGDTLGALNELSGLIFWIVLTVIGKVSI